MKYVYYRHSPTYGLDQTRRNSNHVVRAPHVQCFSADVSSLSAAHILYYIIYIGNLRETRHLRGTTRVKRAPPKRSYGAEPPRRHTAK